MGLFENLTGKGKSFSDSLKYVDDFKIEEVQDAKGRTKKKAVYIGTWTEIREPGKKTIAKLITAAALAVLTFGLLIRILLLTHQGSGTLFVTIPLAVALLPAFYALMGAFSLPYRQKPMRRDQYMHGFVRMQRSAVGIIVFLVLALICSVIFRAIRSDWMFMREDWLFLFLCIDCILCNGCILWILGTIETAERMNKMNNNVE